MLKGDKKKVGLKAQTWSVDLVVGIVVFLLLVIVLYALLSREPAEQKQLRLENEQVLARFEKANSVTTGVPALYEGDNLNEAALTDLYFNENYEDIKQKLGIKGDFCILLIDDTGGVVSFEDTLSVPPEKFSFGYRNDDLEIAGSLYCGD